MGDKDGCCSRAGEGGNAVAAAPFVVKTYWMVEDPETDALIAWGSGNNSFVVVDPFGFAERLLPAHFKHANFSSFVRQLNTYGFRKVDPDRWEFAHELFLRGQTHLLRRIVRRHEPHGSGKGPDGGGGGEVDDGVTVEVARLKWEQRAAEEVMQSMWRRLEETERRPRQMLAFLFKVVQNPHLLLHLKQRRLAAAATPSTAPENDGRQMCTPDDDLRTLPGWQQETCSGQHPREEELLEEAGSLPLARDDEGVPALLPSSDAIEVFLAHSQLSPEFVSGERTGIDEEAAACSAATTYPFVLPTK